MAVTTLSRVFVLTLLCISVRGDATATYSIPDVQVEAFTPKGLRVTLPDAPNIVHFAVQGLLKRHGQTEKIDISGETKSKIHIGDKDVWVVELPDLKLEPNDQIDYLTFVAVNSAGYIRDDLKFKVENVWAPRLRAHPPAPSLDIPATEMPAPCDSCKDTCGGGKAACGANCTCGPSCACGDGKASGGKPCCQGGKK